MNTTFATEVRQSVSMQQAAETDGKHLDLDILPCPLQLLAGSESFTPTEPFTESNMPLLLLYSDLDLSVIGLSYSQSRYSGYRLPNFQTPPLEVLAVQSSQSLIEFGRNSKVNLTTEI